MKRLVATLIAAGVLAVAAPASAAGAWTVSNPQGASYTAAGDGTVVVGIVTSDAYAGRENVTQAHELVVVRRNGAEVGRTADLPDRVASATASASFSVQVAAGDVITIVHSSVVGLSDGTQNSVEPTIGFAFTPTPTTTTTVPAPTSAPTTSSTTVPPTAPPSSLVSSSVPTTTVEVGLPPVPASTVVSEPRPTTTTTSPVASSARLPDTGSNALTAAVAGLCVSAGALFLALTRRRPS